jgi:indole-3-glycerol phosphate synthase
MNILDQIIANKKREVAIKKKLFSINYLESSPLFKKPTISLANRLRKSKSGIIAEHKRRSPSKQNINSSLSVIDVSSGYEKAGVSGISILTDGKYFGGSLEDLNAACEVTSIPILRKEFIIDEYQILESKANGADVILLIASVLSRNEIQKLSDFGKNLSLEILLEVHNEDELNKSLNSNIDMVGVNNRDLQTFKVNLENSKNLADIIPLDFVKVSESGINDFNSIIELQNYGFQGFLVGENFMKSNNPGETAAAFIKKIES